MIDAGEKFFLGCYQIVPVEETFLRAGDVVIARDLLPEQTICDTFVELLRPTITNVFPSQRFVIQRIGRCCNGLTTGPVFSQYFDVFF